MSADLFLGETQTYTFKVVKHQNGRLYWTSALSPNEYLVAILWAPPHRPSVMMRASAYPEGTVVEMLHQCTVYLHGDE